MRGLLCVLVLILIGIAGFGFYRGWFSLSTENADHKPSATFSMDQDKIQADEEKVKDKVHDFGKTVKEKTGNQTDKVNEEKRE
jgi:predicted negative regulator of RcsB-dependent stress response